MTKKQHMKNIDYIINIQKQHISVLKIREKKSGKFQMFSFNVSDFFLNSTTFIFLNVKIYSANLNN